VAHWGWTTSAVEIIGSTAGTSWRPSTAVSGGCRPTTSISIRLLAYSPLGFGVLTGKFLDGARPPEARIVKWTRFARYNGERAERATAAYVAIAREHGLDPAQMALAFVNRQRFVASTLIGAPTMEQLEANLASIDERLSDEVIQAIEGVHRAHPNPCP
jgi:aryl-alcohol dehydrogenase-like predicted oxidoreductase